MFVMVLQQYSSIRCLHLGNSDIVKEIEFNSVIVKYSFLGCSEVYKFAFILLSLIGIGTVFTDIKVRNSRCMVP